MNGASASLARSGDIARLLGDDVDASTIARIEAMNVRIAELMEAIQWMWPDDGVAQRLSHPSSDRVLALVEILSELREEPEDEEPAGRDFAES